jgi:hypothetical protein
VNSDKKHLSGNATNQELPSLRSGEFAFSVAPADVGNFANQSGVY